MFVCTICKWFYLTLAQSIMAEWRRHMRAPTGMPGIAFTYEMDGREHIAINGTAYPIPGSIAGDR